MTYKELYLKEHPECKDIDAVIRYECPGQHIDGGANVFKKSCPYPVGLVTTVCPVCWNREIPEEVFKRFEEKESMKDKNEIDELKAASKELRKANKPVHDKDILTTSSPVKEAIDKACKEFLEKHGGVFKNAADAQKELEDVDNEILKEIIKPAEKSVIPKEVIDKFVELGNVSPISSEDLKKVMELAEKNTMSGKDMDTAAEAAVKASENLAKLTSVILDSGTRREFSTGAVRDIQDGKGRCDLMPLKEISDFLFAPVLKHIALFQETGNADHLYDALECYIYEENLDSADVMLEAAKHFEAGAAKYGEWNWQKGIPTHCYIDSAVRHYLKFLRGDKDEPHDRAFVWNILCCIWTCKHKPELNDYPRKEESND